MKLSVSLKLNGHHTYQCTKWFRSNKSRTLHVAHKIATFHRVSMRSPANQTLFHLLANHSETSFERLWPLLYRSESSPRILVPNNLQKWRKEMNLEWFFRHKQFFFQFNGGNYCVILNGIRQWFNTLAFIYGCGMFENLRYDHLWYDTIFKLKRYFLCAWSCLYFLLTLRVQNICH